MIHLIVGNTGAGKTTYAQRMKSEVQAILFSVDKWNKELFLPDKTDSDGLDWFLERIEREEKIIMDLICQLEDINIDSILDLGFSKYSHREKFRKFAKGNNFRCKLHFLDIPKEERFRRVNKRNTEKGETFEFEVSRESFDFMESWFEAPTKEELKDSVYIKS